MSEVKSRTSLCWHDYFIYKPESGSLIWKPRNPETCLTSRGCSIWNSKYAGKEAGSVHKDPINRERIYVAINSKKYLAHRVCWEMVNGSIPPGLTIDHIDQNPLNNTLSNLRLATQTEQKRNRPLQGNNTSGVNGVSWSKRYRKWRARICVNRKLIEIGLSEDKNIAIQMRKSAEERFGFHENHGKKNEQTLIAANLRAGRKG